MNKSTLAVVFPVLLASCRAAPNQVQHFPIKQSPNYISVETFYGYGPVSSDYTRVFYVQAKKDVDEQKLFVISGDYLVVEKIIKLDVNRVLICISKGNVDRLNRRINLINEKIISIVEFTFSRQCS